MIIPIRNITMQESRNCHLSVEQHSPLVPVLQSSKNALMHCRKPDLTGTSAGNLTLTVTILTVLQADKICRQCQSPSFLTHCWNVLARPKQKKMSRQREAALCWASLSTEPRCSLLSKAEMCNHDQLLHQAFGSYKCTKIRHFKIAVYEAAFWRSLANIPHGHEMTDWGILGI